MIEIVEPQSPRAAEFSEGRRTASAQCTSCWNDVTVWVKRKRIVAATPCTCSDERQRSYAIRSGEG